jgi:hypothetical protein
VSASARATGRIAMPVAAMQQTLVAGNERVERRPEAFE